MGRFLRTRRNRLFLETLETRLAPALGPVFGFGLNSSGGGNDDGYTICSDHAGNVYAGGQMWTGTTDFDPSAGTSNRTGPGAYLAKYSGTGSLLWVYFLTPGGPDTHVRDIAVDGAGNVVFTGTFSGTVDFDLGPGTFNLTAQSSYGGYVCKLDSSGNFLWAGTIQVEPFGIVVDTVGNVYFSGNVWDGADFDPGAGVYNLTAGGPSKVPFLSKWDVNGNFVWADIMQSPGPSHQLECRDIAIDALGNLYITGDLQGVTDFDPGPGTMNLNGGWPQDVFIAKFDNGGNLVWAHQIGSNSGSGGYGIGVDAAGNVYTTGYFSGTVDFDPGPGTNNLTTVGQSDIFLSKLDTAGNLVWAFGIGSSAGYESGDALAVDSAGNTTIMGGFGGTADFDPGALTYNLVPWGLFIAQYDSNGSFVNAANIGQSGGAWTNYAVSLESNGDFYVTGSFNSGDLDPGPATYNVGGEILIAKFTQVLPVLVTPSGGSTAVNEGGGADTFTVALYAPPTANAFITLTPDPQINLSSSVLTFTPATWNTPQTVSVTAINDVIAESNHTGVITGTASSTDPVFNGAIPSVTATINDNDFASVLLTHTGGSTNVTEGGATDTYTAVLTSQPTANVVVSLSGSGQATGSPATITFTPGTWNVPQTLTAAAVNDLAVEGNHTGTITHAATSTDTFYNLTTTLTAGITDNDFPMGVIVTPSAGSTDVSEAGLSDTYTVALNSIPLANVIITLAPGTQLTVSSATLTFTPATWNVAQTVTVQAVDNPVAQGIRSAVIAHTASSTDPGYNALAISGLTVNIADNDVVGATIAPTAVNLSEGGSGSTYSIRLNSRPNANVVVTLNPNAQVSVAPSTVVITPASWNTPVMVTVTAVDDGASEGLHSGLVAHSVGSADPAYNGLSLGSVTASITDNDIPGVLVSQFGSFTLLEGRTRTYTLALSSPPTTDVVVSANPDSQISVTPAAVTFTPADWSVPRPIVVTAVAEGIDEGDHVGIVTHTTASADPVYNGITVPSLSVQIVDNGGTVVVATEKNDQITVTFSPSRILVSMGGKLTSLPGDLEQLMIVAGGGNDNIQVNAPTIPVVVVAGSGTDKVFVTGQTGANNFTLGAVSAAVNGVSVSVWDVESMAVNGKGNTDIFTILDVPAFPVEIKGDQGNDRIIGPDRPNTWAITGADAGTLDSTIKWATVENLQGGISNDSFAFHAGKTLGGVIDGGGGGQDALDWSVWTSAVTINVQTAAASGVKSWQNITSFVGGKSKADKLIAGDQDNLWNISSNNAGDINGIGFRNLENLSGGLQDDTFILADAQGVTGKIDGGAGNDVLDYSSYLSKPVLVNLQTKLATSTGGFANLEQFQGGSGTSDMLVGANKSNAWQLTALGGGAIITPLLAPVTFGNFENLTGGTLTDSFSLDAAGDWLGLLDGASGRDSLVPFAAGPNVWLDSGLFAGTFNGRKFRGIEVRYS